MANFCPHCSNLLLIDQDASGVGSEMRLMCRTCPYVFVLRECVRNVTRFKAKRQGDVISDDDYSTAQRTEINCPKCTHNMAAWFQIQIRSADEPMTTFYQCVKCKHRWRED